MTPLFLAPEDAVVRVKTILGGRGIKQRLFSMGLVPESEWKIIQNHYYGPIVLEKEGMRIGIGQGMANKIMVRIISQGGQR